MKCKYCGAEMPEEANYCARCARPLKHTIPVTQDGKRNTGNSSMPETAVNTYTNTKMGLSVMVAGFISLALSIVYLGFTGIFGIILGIVAVANGDSQMKKVIIGILCSGMAIVISTYLLAATMGGSYEDSAYQTGQMAEEAPETPKKKQPAVSSVPTQKATPEVTLSPEEKIQKALQNGQTAALKNYSEKKTDNIAGKLLESLSFMQTEDYDIANTIAETMLSLYPDGKNAEGYEIIMSYYEEYADRRKEKSGNKFSGIKEKWDEMSEATSQMVSNTFDVQYDIAKNSSGSARGTGYEHAYYAQGLGYNLFLGIWELDETKEYIICTQEAFPRAGKYSLNLIPTGNKITLSNYQGFEREISTYTILSEKDKAEYDNIGQLKTEYDNLTEEEEFYQREIKRVCEEFTE